jgi:hypothetical protein
LVANKPVGVRRKKGKGGKWKKRFRKRINNFNNNVHSPVGRVRARAICGLISSLPQISMAVLLKFLI